MLVFILSLFVSTSMAAFTPTCESIFNFRSYEGYVHAKSIGTLQAKEIVQVSNAKGRSWKFWLGSSGDRYLPKSDEVTSGSYGRGFGNRKEYSTLVSIYQSKGASKVYLIITKGRDQSLKTYLVEFDLWTMKSKVLSEEYRSYYSYEISTNEAQGIVILNASYSSAAKFGSYYFDNNSSKIISTRTGMNRTILHRNTQHSTSRFGRQRLGNFRVNPVRGDISFVKVGDKTYGADSIFWLNGTYLIGVGRKGLEVHKLNFESLELTVVDSSTIDLSSISITYVE